MSGQEGFNNSDWRSSNSREWNQHDGRDRHDGGEWQQSRRRINHGNGGYYNQTRNWESHRGGGRDDYRRNGGRDRQNYQYVYQQGSAGYHEEYDPRRQQSRNASSGRGVDLQQYTRNDGWETVPSRSNRHQQHRANGQTPHSSSQQGPPSNNDSHDEPFMLMLVGIPGSGKSTFAKALEQAAPNVYKRINQDSLGNRKKCEAATRQALSERKIPIIDRCNFDASQRRYFIDIAREFGIVVHVVSLELPQDVCIQRAESRQYHETIQPGEERMVVNKMMRSFQVPHASEGFATVQRLSHENQVNDVMQEYTRDYIATSR